MVEMNAIQGAGSSNASSDISALSTESISEKNTEQIKIKVAEESSSEEERVAVDLSAVVNTRSVEDSSSMPDLMKSESNTKFVSKSEFMAMKNKVQAAEAGMASSSTDARPSFSTSSE